MSDDSRRALVVLVPLPLIWLVDSIALRAFGWPLPAVLVLFFVLWAVLGNLALRVYDKRVSRRERP